MKGAYSSPAPSTFHVLLSNRVIISPQRELHRLDSNEEPICSSTAHLPSSSNALGPGALESPSGAPPPGTSGATHISSNKNRRRSDEPLLPPPDSSPAATTPCASQPPASDEFTLRNHVPLMSRRRCQSHHPPPRDPDYRRDATYAS